MSTSTDNMRVINKEYEEWERVIANPDGLIMSDDLREMMGLNSELDNEEPAPYEHQLSIILDAPECSTISGQLHTIQFMGTQSIGFEVSKCSSEMLQTLYLATKSKGKSKKTVSIILKGDNGFEAEESTISSLVLLKWLPILFY